MRWGPKRMGRKITAAARFQVGFILVSLSAWTGTVWAQAAASAFPNSAPQQNVGAETKSSGSESRQAAEDKSPEFGSPQEVGGQATGDGAAAKSETGFKFGVQEQSEVWANLLGGGHRATSYNGLTTASLDLDLEKSLGWKEARFFVSAIEARPSLKLYELWLEQRLFGTLYLRVGQAVANDEMTSSYGALFLNSSFGFPGLPAAGLPSGGPSYPLATPFARARWKA